MNRSHTVKRFFPARLLGLLAVCCSVNLPVAVLAADTATRLTFIPISFQGKWRLDPAQCSDMAEYGLDLDARKVSYYGTSGSTKLIRQTTPRSIVVNYTEYEFEFGGRKGRTVSYEISADGRTLTETAESGEQTRRVRCGSAVAEPPATQPALIDIDTLVGDWEDGGPACASIRRGRAATSIVFRSWYCEAGEQSATPITLERLGDRVFTHRATDLNIVVHSGRMMQADAGPRSRKQFGDGLYLTDAGRFYNKKTVTSQTVSPSVMPQLRTGAYVSFPTRCAQASNATLEWWNGQFFSGGRKHPAYPRPVDQPNSGRAQSFVADTKGWEDNKVYRVNIIVLSQSMYERDGLRYFHCSEAQLPATWRGSTPPQKKLGADAVVDAVTTQAPVTPAEFREWQGNGNSYGYLCTVKMTSGSLTMRSAPAGRPSGSLANGDTFLLLEVMVTGVGETWYRADPLKAKGAGWVSARFVACDPEHFN